MIPDSTPAGNFLIDVIVFMRNSKTEEQIMDLQVYFELKKWIMQKSRHVIFFYNLNKNWKLEGFFFFLYSICISLMYGQKSSYCCMAMAIRF